MLESGVWRLEYLFSWRVPSTHPPPPRRNQQVAGYFKDKERFSTLSSLELGTHYSAAVDAKIPGNKKRKNRSLVLHPSSWALCPVQGDLGFSTFRIIVFFSSLPQVKCAKSPANRALNVMLPPATCANHTIVECQVQMFASNKIL